MTFLKSLKLDGILSFPPGSEAIPLTPLNVLIGPNGSGKSNLIEGIELLHALPISLAGAMREGGGVREWLWKGEGGTGTGGIEAGVEHFDFAKLVYGGLENLYDDDPALHYVSYRIAFSAVGQRVEVVDEAIEKAREFDDGTKGAPSYFRFEGDNAVVYVKGGSLRTKEARSYRQMERRVLKADESILAQIKDPFVYPELTELGRQFEQIRIFREWTIGRDADVRKPQPADLPNDYLLPDSRNLGLILNQLEHSGAWSEFNGYLARFLPRFQRFSTRVEGGTVQFYLHENGLNAPVPATRLSDGTIRFMAILAQLLSPTPPPLICMEEPELGLHPDAIALLATLLQEASTRTQLIVTTHSDILLSALTEVADSVLVCEYRNGTVLERVESSELRFWLEKYRLGEIWRIGQLGGNV